MTNYLYDAAHPLPTGSDEVALVLTDAGNALVDLAVPSTTGIAIQAAASQRVVIGSSGVIHGHGHGIDLHGMGSGVSNEGSIQSDTADALHFAGGGTSSVSNLGTIAGTHAVVIASTEGSALLSLYNAGGGTVSATDVAVTGGAGDDRIANLGTIKTLASAAGAHAIDLGAGNDLYDGVHGHLTGVVDLGTGNDTAYGGADNETFVPGTGNNTIDGGLGNDTVDYSAATGALTINLHTITLQATIQPSGATSLTQFDQILDVENIIGSAQNDVLIGSDGNNTLYGGAGDDILEGGFANDLLDGGTGSDTVRYTGTFAVTVSLAEAGAQNTGPNGSDTLAGIENLEGGAGGDRLTGNGGDNRLAGGAGNDTLVGGLGNDILNGGTGLDTAVYSGARSAYAITPHADGTTTIAGPDGTDTLTDIRLATFADQTVALTNSAPSSIFLSATGLSEGAVPGSSVASLFGSDPDGDALTLSLVSDAGGLFSLDGSKLILNRPLDYETAQAETIAVQAKDAYGMTLVKSFTLGVRNVVETAPLTVKGTAGADVLAGENGHDRVYGLARNDTLWGEGGNDTLVGGAGNDTLVGGAGKDVFVLDAKPNVKSNVDYFYDFSVKDDTIWLDNHYFRLGKGSPSKPGKLDPKMFYSGNHVHDATDRIVYDKKTGALFYDSDGTGKHAAIQIATLKKGLKLTYHDFFVI